MIASIVAGIGAAIGKQVVTYMEDHRQKVLFERMQAEILEGWTFKLKTAIKESHMRHDVPLEAHKATMAEVDRIIKKEFDTTKL